MSVYSMQKCVPLSTDESLLRIIKQSLQTEIISSLQTEIISHKYSTNRNEKNMLSMNANIS